MEVRPLQEHRSVKLPIMCGCTNCSLSKTPCPGGEWGLKFSACSAAQAVCMAIRLDHLNKGGSSSQFTQTPSTTLHQPNYDHAGLCLLRAPFSDLHQVCRHLSSGSESRKLFFKDCKA